KKKGKQMIPHTGYCSNYYGGITSDLSVKYGNSFHSGGPRKLEHRWSQEKTLFESWRDGCTGAR
ncbi:hypothetical protein, partial [Staphylococcus aureus]|uniref:hypothetical protein n=1 Tax=Staphylococcus aureus TaxID=1280 RepID=UPI0038B2E7C2